MAPPKRATPTPRTTPTKARSLTSIPRREDQEDIIAKSEGEQDLGAA